MTFKALYNSAPDQLKKIVDQTKTVEQNPVYHPEGNTYIHTELVTDRLVVYKNINLSLAGLFHDLGKFDTTVYDQVKNTWTAHDHETFSAQYVDTFADWIVSMGGDVETVREIVLNHMRVKLLDTMKHSKKAALISNKYFDLIRKFQSADFGGTDPNCKQLIDIKPIEAKIARSKIGLLQQFCDKFYVTRKDKFYIFKTRKPFIVTVGVGITKSNRTRIKL